MLEREDVLFLVPITFCSILFCSSSLSLFCSVPCPCSVLFYSVLFCSLSCSCLPGFCSPWLQLPICHLQPLAPCSQSWLWLNVAVTRAGSESSDETPLGELQDICAALHTLHRAVASLQSAVGSAGTVLVCPGASRHPGMGNQDIPACFEQNLQHYFFPPLRQKLILNRSRPDACELRCFNPFTDPI